MLQTDLDRKIFMAQSFLDSTILNERTIAFPIEANSVNSPEEVQAKLENIKLGIKHVTHFLYAMVFELSIKIIWEIEHGKEPQHRHNILHLYKQLSQASQQKISDMYDDQVSNMEKLISECNGRRNEGGEIVNLNLDLQSLEDALEVNEQIVKNFKYDAQLNGKSSVLCSIMWDGDTMWILPRLIADAITFPKALLKYAISLQC